MKLTQETTLFCPHSDAKPIAYALKALKRDMTAIFGNEPPTVDMQQPHQIRVAVVPSEREEAFTVRYEDDAVIIEGSDDLGAVFGIYYVCEHALGIDPYGFWTDFPVQPRAEIDLPEMAYTSPEPKVRFRGWFINDEDLLIGWHDEMEISLATWEIIYETILRTGFNMVIAGTGSKPMDAHLQLASDMGVWLTQHHAEPLGARYFSDAYPGIPARIPEELDRFVELYREAINLHRGRKIVWSLGYRGQGDSPFFRSDPRYATKEARGKAIGDMIQLQKNLVEEVTDTRQHFAHNVYSESAELYREGHLTLDDDIIRVWADNGFGAMRARREWNREPHVSSLPLASDQDRDSGVYYHVSFHDLQLASVHVPFVAPELIQDQYQQLFDAGNIRFLTLNVSNIRPHVFNIDFIGKLIRFPDEHFNGELSPVEQHYAAWAKKYFPGHEADIRDLIQGYHDAFFRYGPLPDEVAGEQVAQHGLRNAISAIVNGRNVLDSPFTFHYIPDPVETIEDCFNWLLAKTEPTLPKWTSLQAAAEVLEQKLDGYQAQFFTDNLRMQIDYMANSYQGLVYGLRGLLTYMNENYLDAFCLLSQSKWAMEAAWEAFTRTEHDKWINFFRGEWLTGTQETIRWLNTARSMAKIAADTRADHYWPAFPVHALGVYGQASIHTIIQAITDDDSLARALIAAKEGHILSPSTWLT
ncbi:MAG: glycosyl hydrolase 115 family protein [Anaerolineaceae bacterium]|nr:glycosyl hydrolase 115 family protein [Anaerolineaceae bacterium]